jgi:hypothetical protein
MSSWFTNAARALGQTVSDGNRSYANDAEVPGLIADSRQMSVAGRDAAASITNSKIPATTAALRTGIAEGQETLKGVADSTTAAVNQTVNTAMLVSAAGISLAAVNAIASQKQSSAMETRAQVSVADHNLAYQTSVQGIAGKDRASWVVKDAISIVKTILKQTRKLNHLKPAILLIGDYHDTHASTWRTINELTLSDAENRALFPENQLDCLVNTLQAAIEVAVRHLTLDPPPSEKGRDIKPLHFFFILRGHGDIQFAQNKQRHEAITIPFELSRRVTIIGRGGRGDTNTHALHMNSRIEVEPRDFVSIFVAKDMFWYVDAWRSGVSLYQRGRERLGWRPQHVGGAGGIASVAGAWGVEYFIHAGAVYAGTALVAPGAVYGIGEVCSRWHSEDYTITDACTLLGIDRA